MMEIKGKVNTALCYAKVIEDTAIEQIQRMCDCPFAEGSRIRIMPDVHAGKGCTIGTTMTVRDKAVPNVVGVDIGCGMYTVNLGKAEINMRDGSVLAVGRGNPEWNFSAPHGEGRIMSRTDAPDCLSGDRGFESRRGCHTAPSSNRRGRQPLKLVMLSSSLTGVTMDHRGCAAGHCFPEPAGRGQKAFQSPQLPVTCLTMPAGAGTGPENRGWPLGHGDRHLRQAPYLE